jgi:Zn-dependent alcohol dehydrogenase
MDMLRAAKLCLIMEYFEDKCSLVKTNVGRGRMKLAVGSSVRDVPMIFLISCFYCTSCISGETLLCHYIQLALNSIHRAGVNR